MLAADPRPLYRSFVQHWLAGVIKEHFPQQYERLGVEFAVGGAAVPQYARERG